MPSLGFWRKQGAYTGRPVLSLGRHPVPARLVLPRSVVNMGRGPVWLMFTRSHCGRR